MFLLLVELSWVLFPCHDGTWSRLVIYFPIQLQCVCAVMFVSVDSRSGRMEVRDRDRKGHGVYGVLDRSGGCCGGFLDGVAVKRGMLDKMRCMTDVSCQALAI